jgi:hypothetical protein
MSHSDPPSAEDPPKKDDVAPPADEKKPPAKTPAKKQTLGVSGSKPTGVPSVTPLFKCRLRLLELRRIKDWFEMEDEFVTNAQTSMAS